jgi:hypothetical protein
MSPSFRGEQSTIYNTKQNMLSLGYYLYASKIHCTEEIVDVVKDFKK